jgi:hypothetical protein
MENYLRQRPEAIPAWLADYAPGTPLDFENIIRSRLVYYPGAGEDGQPVRLFAGSGSAHCFLYVDYGMTREAVEAALANPGFSGYHIIGNADFAQTDLTPQGWQPVSNPGQIRNTIPLPNIQPYCIIKIFERNEGLDETHGVRRFAVVFLCGDGIASYNAIWDPRYRRPAPFAIVLQDHGFGGNYDKFGRGGLFENVAMHLDVFPKFLLVADNTEAWHNYELIPNLIPKIGGSGNHSRQLYAMPPRRGGC